MKSTTLVGACVLACAALPLKSQDLSYNFDSGTTPPTGWVLTGGARIESAGGRGGGGALVMDSPESRATLTVVDPSYVQFLRHPPQTTDDFTLDVSSTCGSAPGFQFSYRPEAADPGPFLMTHVNARYAGPCVVTFALRDYRAGKAVIDDVDVGRLSPGAKTDIEANQRVVTILQRQRYEADLTGAQNRLRTNENSLVDNTQGLAVRVSRTYALEAIQSLGSAMALRSAINNPLDYPQFDSVITKLGTVNKPLEAHTLSLRTTVSGVFGAVKSALQGDLFDAASKLVSTTSVLRGLRDSVRDVLALSSTNDQARHRLADVLKIDRNASYSGIANVYTTTTNFLNQMVEDAEHVDASARVAAELANRTRRSAVQGDSLILEVLRFAGLPATQEQLQAYKRAAVLNAERVPGPYPILDSVRTAIRTKAASAENTAAAEKIASMNELAGRLEVYLRGIQHANTGLEPLVGEQTAFFRTELDYLCNLEAISSGPADIQAKWREKTQEAIKSLQEAEAAFYQAYKFERPRARSCKLLTNPA